MSKVYLVKNRNLRRRTKEDENRKNTGTKGNLPTCVIDKVSGADDRGSRDDKE